jgi:nicotinate-nucleotide--dimethylbenzimidazole phosphoribosyltransferase
MSDSTPAGPVFPPFAPGPQRSYASAPRPAPTSAPAPAAAAEAETPVAANSDDRAPDAAPAADPSAAGEEAMPWEMPSAPDAAAEPATASDASAEPDSETADDLPWLEMPSGAPQARAAEPAGEPWTASVPAADDAPWAATEPAGTTDEAPWSVPTPEVEPPANPMPWDSPGDAEVPPPHELAPVEAPQTEPAVQAPDLPADEPAALAVTAAESDYLGAVDVQPAPGLVPVGDMSVMDPAERGSSPAAEPRAEPQPVSRPANGAAAAHFSAVAARLERIARELRADPQAFLAAGSSDPLDLLVTGFVLGASARRG